MSHRRAALALLAFVSLASVASCERGAKQAPPPPDPWASKAVVRDPLKKPLFWSATKDGHTLYFLGTMHTGIDAEARLPQLVFDKLDAAPAFAMETDIGDPVVAKAGTRTDGGTLHKDLGDEYFAKLQAQLGAQLVQSIDGMKPMVAATLLSLKGLPPTPPMDRVLLGRALDKQKAIIYLEPASLQVEVLEKVMGVRELKLFLDHPERGPIAVKQAVDGYLAGDENVFIKLSAEEKADALEDGIPEAEYDESQEAILYRRNASWIERLEKMAADGGGFVAVGAMHLAGPRSVLDLLAQKGFTVTRVVP